MELPVDAHRLQWSMVRFYTYFPVSLALIFTDQCVTQFHSLRAVRSRDRILVWARFPYPSIAALGPTQHPVSGYRVSFPGVKRPGRGVDHPPLSSAEVKERV